MGRRRMEWARFGLGLVHEVGMAGGWADDGRAEGSSGTAIA